MEGKGNRLVWVIAARYAYRPSFEIDASEPDLLAPGNTLLASAELEQHLIMLEPALGIALNNVFQAEVGIGLGAAFNNIGTATYSTTAFALPPVTEDGATRTEFAWSPFVRLGYQLSDRTALQLGYRYVDSGEFRTSGNTSVGPLPPVPFEMRDHEVWLGIKVSLFGQSSEDQ